MTPQRWQQVKALFDRVVECDPASKPQLLRELCGTDEDLYRQVEALLASDHTTHPRLQSPIINAGNADATMTMPSGEPSPTAVAVRHAHQKLGDYEILRPLGRGGMGTVYLARRADGAFNKHVAIKILRSDAASPDIIRRFQREREILAQLDHPHIARLLDAGETEDGLPYFVMEYVEGRTITDYADEQRLPIAERLGLFRQMGDAVEYAHQHKVIHRDLKPGNVLVTSDGRVKLLDFGIAGLVEREAGASKLTQTGMWLMTPEYASPEQVRGETVGRASDVYSLAVILFELLTGHRPYHMRSRIFHEIVRVVCEEPPTRPSAVVVQPLETTTAEGELSTLPPETAARLRQISLSDLRQQLSGDLDNILLKALDKLPYERYASVLQLGADIDRHINGESVWAGGNSSLYQLGRVLSRYRVALVALTVLAAAIASGAINLRLSALWWFAGGIALIGIWHGATDPKIGRRIAASSVPVLGLVILGILFSAIGIFAIYKPDKWGPVFFGISLSMVFTSIGYLAAWLCRSRWTGPLVLDISHKSYRAFGAIGSVLAVLFILLTIIQPANLLHVSQMSLQISSSTLVWLGLRREVRRDGLIVGGRLIRWNRIDSWNWEKDNLVLRLHRSIKFLPPVRVKGLTSQKKQVEAILARQLGEWPSAAKI